MLKIERKKLVKSSLLLLLVVAMVATSLNLDVLRSDAASKKYVDYDPNRYVETTANVNMRTKSTTSSSNITTIPKGKRILAYGYDKYSSSSWYKVSYGGKIGYIKSSYAKLSYQDYSPNLTGTTKTNIYMRSGVGADYSKKIYIRKGKKVTLYGYYRTAGYDWYKIGYGGKTGYASSKYVKRNEEVPKWVGYDPDRYGDVTDAVVLRSKSKTSGSALVTIPKGARILLSGYDKYSTGSWYKTSYNGKSGYVHADYVNLSYEDYAPDKPGTTTANIYMRSGVGAAYTKLNYIKKGSKVTIFGYYRTTGSDWYKISYGGKTGYASSKYVVRNGGIDATFPESYKTKLAALQKQFPAWTFIADHTNVSWATAVKNEMRTVSRQLVSPNSPDSWKSKASGAYDAGTGKYVVFDGKWNAASKDIVEYYLDPRNFFDGNYIYQFMPQQLDTSYQTLDTVKKAAERTFMGTDPAYGAKPYGQRNLYSDIYNAGLDSKVNPNVLVSMIIMEQGRKGGSNGLVSGTYKGYEGYYNFFNIGAYAHDGNGATVNGLIYAKSKGWNTERKSIAAGAEFYANNYIDNNQFTFYTKKYDVLNGADKMGLHEYSTNVAAGADEGRILGEGFDGLENLPLQFHIPVFTSMPASNPKPN